MILYTIDNEPAMLQALNTALMQAAPHANLYSFSTPDDLLRAFRDGTPQPDAVFLDIELPGMNGLALAARISAIDPLCWLVFVTCHTEYALAAFSLHARGYFIKPVCAGQMRAVLEDMCRVRSIHRPQRRVRVQTFGNFDVFVDDVPLNFSRSKAKEMFAYLVHQRGASCTTKELAAVLFEDAPYDNKQMNYLQKLAQSMCKAFSDAGAWDVILRKYGLYAVNTPAIECDFYRYATARTPNASDSFAGEYMSQYSWAETTRGLLNKG